MKADGGDRWQLRRLGWVRWGLIWKETWGLGLSFGGFLAAGIRHSWRWNSGWTCSTWWTGEGRGRTFFCSRGGDPAGYTPKRYQPSNVSEPGRRRRLGDVHHRGKTRTKFVETKRLATRRPWTRSSTPTRSWRPTPRDRSGDPCFPQEATLAT